MLAARCAVRGLDISRGTLSKIEAQLRYVTDTELETLAEVLGVGVTNLFPQKSAKAKRS